MGPKAMARRMKRNRINTREEEITITVLRDEGVQFWMIIYLLYLLFATSMLNLMGDMVATSITTIQAGRGNISTTATTTDTPTLTLGTVSVVRMLLTREGVEKW